MKYEVGDKVKINGVIREIENITQWDKNTQRYKFVGVSGWHEIKRGAGRMKTNYYRALGVLILWSILIVNMNMELAIWEQLFVGMGVWFISQEEGLRK